MSKHLHALPVRWRWMVLRLRSKVVLFRNEQRGQGLVEYLVILMLIIVLMVVALW
jgi:hypothetical protein